MLLTLGAAGATLLVVLSVLGVPALDACNGDTRGLVNCLRGIVDDKFDLGLDPPPVPAPAPKPIVAEAPAPAEPAPEVQVAETPATKPAAEPSRSLAPQVAETPAIPAPPKVIAAPPVAATPDPAPTAPELPAPEEPVAEEPAAPAETIALATVVEPAPSFVPPSSPIGVTGVPPDLLVAADEPAFVPVDPPAAQAEAPSFVPPAATTTVDGVPPDLQVAAIAPVPVDPPPAAPAEAPSFVPPAPAIAVDGVPPDLSVAAVEPDPTPAAPAPDFVLPSTPDLPRAPPPDLTVAAVDPVVPTEPAPAAMPLLAPSIDAVEIDGDGNFIAGNGPAGATMRLYVDGIPVGVSPVEGGRWLVEGPGLLADGRQTLRVEALDPLTGKQLGEATVVYEGPTEPVAGEPAPAAIAPEPATGQPEATTDQLVLPAVTTGPEPATDEPAAGPLPPAIAPEPATEQPEAVTEQPMLPSAPVEPEAIAEPDPALVPEITPVVPVGETPSVTILKPAAAPAVTTLPTGKASDDAVVTLGAAVPASPAIIAQFTLPVAAAAPDVTVLRAIPIGDPGAGRFVSGKAIIRRGDTLWDIAHRYYGRGVHYRTIVRANRALIARPGRIYPGQVFDLPLVYDD